MIALGVRVTTKEILYVVATGSSVSPTIATNGKLKAPKSYDVPATLAWYREQFIGVCKEQLVQSVIIRTAEPTQRSHGAGVIFRCNVEGVLAESGFSTGLITKVGPLITLGSILDIKKPKNILEQSTFSSIPQWSSMTRESRESTLAAIAGLKLLEKN